MTKSKYFKAKDAKGQLILKPFFGYLQFFQRTNKKIDLTTMAPQVELFSFVFWKKVKTPKNISKLTDL